MNVDDALEIVESQVLSRQLTPIERLIFCQSWEGKGYVEIADGSGYNSNYFKELGSKLWHNLSEVLQQKVTKKNLQLVLKDYQANSTNQTNSYESSQQLKTVRENICSKSGTCNHFLTQNSVYLKTKPFDHIKFPALLNQNMNSKLQVILRS